MKKTCIVISAFLLVVCSCSRKNALSSAEQTKPPLVAEQVKQQQPAEKAQPLLTAEQVTSLATRLADDKLVKLYHRQSYFSGSLARFEAGHWIWTGEQVGGHGVFNATVELASDGSTQRVDVVYKDGWLP
jgi:hypothetical protein